MKIRLAKDEDYAAMARLHRQTIREVNAKDYTEDQIRVWSARPKAERFRRSSEVCKRWVAVEHDKVIGFCDHGLDGKFSGLYVHKDYIGKGVGSRLITTAEKSLQKMGFKKNTIRATVTAKEFYKKQGYKVVKKELFPLGDTKLETFVMVKMLQ